jgi:hypothetical protein
VMPIKLFDEILVKVWQMRERSFIISMHSYICGIDYFATSLSCFLAEYCYLEIIIDRLVPPLGRASGRLSLLHNAVPFGNNLCTDMLEQYGEIGTN